MDNVFIKQKRIGFILSIGTLIIAIVHLFLFLSFNFGTIQCKNSMFFNFVFSFLFSLSAFLTSLKNNKISKIYQMGIFLIISIYSSILNGPADITSIVFFVYFLILFWTYYKSKIKIEWLFLMSIIYTIFITIIRIFTYSFINNFINQGHCVLGIENNYIKLIISIIFFVSFVGMYFSLLYVTLAGELKQDKEKIEVIKNELIRNESYIWYGKNVTGVVHNIKNKLTPIYMLLQEIKNEKCLDEDIKYFINNQIENSDNIVKLLDQLLFIIKNKNTENSILVNVNYLVLSVCEYLKSNLEFKNNVNLKIENLNKDLFIETKPFYFIQVIENIISNSWDSIKNKNIKNIIIKIDSENKNISIEDSGCGIKECFKCKNKRCFNDCNIFKLGKTSKENGLGYGMLFIGEYIVENKIKAEINSNTDGTKITLYF